MKKLSSLNHSIHGLLEDWFAGMSLRGRLSFSRNRRDMTMDKPNGGMYRNQIWFVVLGSFMLWFFLFYFNSVAFNSSKIKVQAIFYSFMSPEAIPELVMENRTTDASEQASPLVVDKRDDGYPKHRDEEQAAVVEQNIKPFNKEVVEGNNHVTVNELPADAEENKEEPAASSTENQDELIAGESMKSMLGNGDESANDEGLLVNEDHVKKGPVNHHQVPVVVNRTRLENRNRHVEERKKVNPLRDPCFGKYIYVHNLPSRFNDDIIKECRSLNIWVDTCPTMANGGLGPRIGHSQGVFTSRGWFATDQFTLEVIFHNRMKQYKCLTDNSSLASAVFVPFYSGLDVERYLWGFNASSRDATSLDLVKWLGSRPEWKVLGGRDHFLVAGRITWDFRRMTDTDADWGNKLLNLPEGRNMSTLVIEASPWHRNDFAIPYPTYFHPSSDIEIFQWQNRMKRQKRRVLFAFAGAPRPSDSYSIRGHIISQCQASKKSCKLLDCSNKATAKLCYKPINVMKMFQSSVFCLQPSGDSFTRRSAFDSIVAGCIPVFFNPGSAYVQYIWHLPKDFTKYSVFISENDIRDGKVNIETVLSRIPKEKVIAMREEVIKLIPRVIYADPRSRLETVEDAFDIAVEGVIERVNKIREASEGRTSELRYREENTWKYNLYGTEEKHEWDHFFANPKK